MILKIDPTIARKIKEIYGSAERSIYAYGKPGDHQYKYTVPFPDSPIPETHPENAAYRLLGEVNLLTGTITLAGRSGSNGGQKKGQKRLSNVDWGAVAHNLVAFCKFLLQALFYIVVVLAAIVTAVTGSRR